ncbi:MAG TPA: SRPBCC family protein [Actinomycetota bacterium]|nr:SRPBCC family protein [Actinomycetota bacterium]
MTTSHSAKLTFPSDTQILITRDFAAPKELVYKAVTTPELVKRWWNAKRGEVTTAEIDLRVGGRWRSVMVTPDGFEVGFHGEYREIVPNERIVQTEAYEGAPDPDDNATTNTMTLVEQNGVTTMTVLIDCPSAEVRDAIVESGMEEGLQDAYDLLEEVAISLR